MQKILNGIVVSNKMANTVVVEVTRKVAHPLYKKLIKKSKKFTADSTGIEVNVGDRVKIGSIRPISKTKYFKVLEVIK
jgi:small subunit ribosomal protein S17